MLPAIIARLLCNGVDRRVAETLPPPERETVLTLLDATDPNSAFEGLLARMDGDAAALRRAVLATDPTAPPQIGVTGRRMREISADALSALALANLPPQLFVRGGELARVSPDERGRPLIERLGEASLRGVMARVADFVKVGGGDYVHIPPPLDIVRDVLTLGKWPFPPLTGVVETPVIRPDGTVLCSPGYDEPTGLWYHATGQTPPVPDRPTAEQVSAALALLREPFYDFPYISEADRTNALALLLTPLLRPAIPGPVPLALVNATQQGTGKSLHAEIVSIVATGRGAVMSPMTRDDEMQKQLYASLLVGETVIVFDNVEGRIYSPTLARALTAGEFGGRVLGESRAVGLPQRATWIATGNALQLGGDMARRCYPINLDAKMSQPWQRTGFRHPNLLEWVREHRGALISAALTLARGWWAAGCPPAPSPIIGGFEAWCRIVGGVLAFVGAHDFLGNLRAMYESADEESRQWEAFILSLAERFSKPTTVADVCRAIEQDAALQEVVPDIGEEPLSATGTIRPKFKQMIGIAFRRRVGRRHGDSQARIERATGEGRVAQWTFRHG